MTTTDDSIRMLHAAGVYLDQCVVDHRDKFGLFGYVTEYRLIGEYGRRWVSITDRDPAKIVGELSRWMGEVDADFWRVLELAGEQ